MTRDKFNEACDEDCFNPKSENGLDALIGNGTTTREEKTTTTKIILEAAPGTKATVEGEDNPAIQITPTGGL